MFDESQFVAAVIVDGTLGSVGVDQWFVEPDPGEGDESHGDRDVVFALFLGEAESPVGNAAEDAE